MKDEIIVYYCIDDIGLTNEVGEMLKMSITSAVENSGLSVKCLYCGDNEKFVNLLSEIGVEVIYTKSRIDDAIIDAHRNINFPLHARGAYLRYEISEIDRNNYSLYVDCDVFFASKFILPETLPQLVSACNELHNKNEFNSGVLLFNNVNFKNSVQDFLNYAKANFGSWAVGVDQRPFNDFYQGSIESLDNSYNWRPSFGINDDARMIHFHGTKVEETFYYLTNNIPEQYLNPFIIERANNCSKDLDSVVYYLKFISKYLNASTSPEYSRKLKYIIDTYSIKYLSKTGFIKNANSFLIENFLMNELGFGHININKILSYSHRSGVASIALFPAKNFFLGTIEIDFINCESVLKDIVLKSTGYLETSYSESSIFIKFCTLSYAAELYLQICDLYFDTMTIKIRGLGMGPTSAVDSNAGLIQVSDFIT